MCAQSEPEKTRIELQVDILEWLGTAAKLAVHLAQVSQVDNVQVTRLLAESAAIGLAEFLVPRVDIHEVVCLELS